MIGLPKEGFCELPRDPSRLSRQAKQSRHRQEMHGHTLSAQSKQFNQEVRKPCFDMASHSQVGTL